MLKPNELDFLLRDAAIDTVVVAEATRPLVDGLDVRAIPLTELLHFCGPSPEAPIKVDADDTAVMLYTSGTSGKPKGVPLSHTNLLSNARALITRAGVESHDVFLSVLPMFHAFGLTGTLTIPLLLGAEVSFLRFSPERAATAIAERQVTVFIAVPSMFGLLARCKAPDGALANLALPVCGGEALPQNVRAAYRTRFGRDLLEGYGLTETSPVVAINLPGEDKAGTVGRPLPGVEVRVADDGGQPQPTGGKGEVQVRGPNVMNGYYNRPEENAVTFSADGWFRTGDEGLLDEEGFLRITGRIKELIIRGGEKIMPREVEDVLCMCPGVQEAAVLGEPDGDRGEAVVAFVVPAGESPTPEALRDFCRARLAEFKVPRRFTIAKDLPRGATGKILKRALRDWKPAQ
jgi:long-chain acyl-CoA synthetase